MRVKVQYALMKPMIQLAAKEKCALLVFSLAGEGAGATGK